MTIAGFRCLRGAAVLASLAALCSSAAGAASPPDFAAVTDKVREILRKDDADSVWGADPPAEETAARGEPFAATALIGSGHALLILDSDGRPLGSHLWLLHVRVEGDQASASECVLRLGKDDDRSCPPAPLALVECATWSVPAEAARAALLAARDAPSRLTDAAAAAAWRAKPGKRARSGRPVQRGSGR